MVTDQGLIDGQAHDTLRYRRSLGLAAEIFADVHVKHAVPLGNLPIGIAAKDTIERGLADALIVSGSGTGVPAAPGDVRAVREACPGARILIGSGITAENAAALLPLVDGFIVGSSLKVAGKIRNAVDAKRVASLLRAINRG
jgi:membrane complex biogenesis BtpA family protein